jgi:acetyltransferase
MSGSQRLDSRIESRGSLDVFFTPKSVAVIGATERAGSVGRTVVSNLLAGQFGGPVYPVNPKHASVGARAYPSVGDVPGPVDLAVIVRRPNPCQALSASA